MIASSSPTRRLAGLAAASLAALLVSAVADPAAARSDRGREPKRDDSVLSRPAGVPLMAIVEHDLYPTPPDVPLPIATRTNRYYRGCGLR